MSTTTRDFESFTWFTLRRLKIMIGFRWSSDWFSTKPWSVNGEPVPFVALQLIDQNENTCVHGLFLGPMAVIYGKRN